MGASNDFTDFKRKLRTCTRLQVGSFQKGYVMEQDDLEKLYEWFKDQNDKFKEIFGAEDDGQDPLQESV